MTFDPQIPIGKAKDEAQDGDDAEVSGHGLLFDTGEPAAHVAPDAEEPAEDETQEGEGQRHVLDSEQPSEGDKLSSRPHSR